MRVGLPVKIWLTVFALLATQAQGAEHSAGPPLSRPISHFSIGQTSALDALLWFGRDNRLCLGIEFSGPELDRQVHVEADHTTVGDVMKEILGSRTAYQFLLADGVILIRRRGGKPPAWLDHRLRQFEQPRMELMSADAGLWMALERGVNPSQQGFAGDSPLTEPIDDVGPFNERRKTVRQLLIKIVGSSRGASWFPTSQGVGVSFPASINRFWTLVTYSGPIANRPR